MVNPLKYLEEVRSEFVKVNWPSRSETVRLSTIVIIASIVVGFIITILDIGFTKLASLFI